jgi:hypothetical protein
VDATLLIGSGIFWSSLRFLLLLGAVSGGLLWQRGRLYRVGQQRRQTIWAALVFNEVVTLTKADYQEVQTKTIEPGFLIA